MSAVSRPRRRGPRPALVLGLLALLLGLLAPPMAALAHPLDEYLQATYITVAPGEIVVEVDFSPGVLLAPQVLSELDSNGDQVISDAESRAYVDAIVPRLVLEVDGQPLALTVTKIEMPPYLNIQAGYGMIRVFASAALVPGMTGAHEISYTNTFAPPGASYQVNAFVDKDAAITLGKQNRDSIQQSMTVAFDVAGAQPQAAAAPAVVETTGATVGASEQSSRLLGYLYAPTLSPWVLLLALGLAGALGGLHALTPGHGKTLVAAYLVGSRGTVRHAVALGAIVTFTHTASVIAIGLLALFASQVIVPDVLVPLLGIVSGLLVVVMGARLVVQRWRALQGRDARNAHGHDHQHSQVHDAAHSAALIHDHGDGHVHTHLPPAQGVTPGGLVAMGVSGGLVPCPEALGIMVIAVGLNRIALGLGLIVSFSFGLAAVLIAIGILLVRSRRLVERVGGIGGRWSSALPLVSAVIVTLLGIGITVSGLATYLG